MALVVRQNNKPKTSFAYYLVEQQETLLNELRKVGSSVRKGNVTHTAELKWKALTYAQKEPYVKLAVSAEKEIYGKAKGFYRTGWSSNDSKTNTSEKPENKENLPNAEKKEKKETEPKTEKKHIQPHADEKTKKQDSNEPKALKGSAYGIYLMFLADKLEEIKKSLPADQKKSAVSKAAGAMWAAMDASAKKQYKQAYAQNEAADKTAVDGCKKNGDPVVELIDSDEDVAAEPEAKRSRKVPA